MAGEWVFGGVEAKGFAYVLVFLALEALWQGRWNRVWLLLGASSSFHVLTGGWSVIAAMFVWLCAPSDRPALKSMVPALLGGLALALPGLIPALALSWGVDRAVVSQANEIYVHQRLSHHLVFHKILLQPLTLDFVYLGLGKTTFRLTHLFFLRHLFLVAAWLVLCWKLPWGGAKRVHFFVLGAIMIAIAGIMIDQLTLYRPDLSAGLLRYYWFRLSDAMVPVGLALAGAVWIQRQQAEPWRRGLLLVAITLVSLFVTDAFLRRWADPRPDALIQAAPSEVDNERRFADWRAACRWITASTDASEIVLTPREQQTFKWYAARGEVVNRKDIPQDALGIIEWWRRLNEIYPDQVRRGGLACHELTTLRELAERYDFRYMLIDRAKSVSPPQLQRVYPPPGSASASYEVYRLPTDATPMKPG